MPPTGYPELPDAAVGRVRGVAGDYIRNRLDRSEVQTVARFLIDRSASEGTETEADWASYLLFDGGYAGELIEGGRADAHAKADEIRRFYAD
jgi:NTE family protein